MKDTPTSSELRTATRLGTNIAERFVEGRNIALRVLDGEQITGSELRELFNVNLLWKISTSYASSSELRGLSSCAALVGRALASNPQVDFSPFASAKAWLKREHTLRTPF